MYPVLTPVVFHAISPPIQRLSKLCTSVIYRQRRILYQLVHNTNCPVDPIPILRTQYDAWKIQQQADAVFSTATLDLAYLPANGIDSAKLTIALRNHNNALLTYAHSITLSHTGGGSSSAVTSLGGGTFGATIHAPSTGGPDTITVNIDAGGQITTLSQKPVLTYYLSGDAEGGGSIDISDAVWLIAYIFAGGPAPVPLLSGDANCDKSVDISDAVYLIAYIFASGPAPCY